jgi:TatD DNase family protein
LTKIRIIDTHCHLDSQEFDADREQVVRNAAQSGVRIITSSIRPSDYSKTLGIAESFSGVYAAIGLDPMIHREYERAVDEIRSNHASIVGVGETGLDYYYERSHEERSAQESVFATMIELAAELGLPIQVHSRSAGRRALEILEGLSPSEVHMHAFDGKDSLARHASRELGYYFSIPTSVVRSPQKRKLVKAVEYERLLVETDSPVLGPDKDMRNEPANVWLALREVAAILGREEEEVRSVVMENTLRLYSRIGTNHLTDELPQ